MSHTTHPHLERRSRGEIDRNYFFGDTFIRAGSCLWIALALVAVIAPVSLSVALADGMYEYVTLMALFALIGLVFILYGRHLRRCATHWDKD